MVLGVDYGTISGGGGYEEGDEYLPMASTITIPLSFQPSAVYLYYVNSADTTKYCVAYGDGVNAISGDTTNGSSGTMERCILTPIATGFTLQFTASNTAYWQNNKAHWVAIK